MNVLGSAAIVQSTDRAGAVSRFAAIFGAPPLHEFQIDGRDLSVSVFPGVSVLAGPASALETPTGTCSSSSRTPARRGDRRRTCRRRQSGPLASWLRRRAAANS
jgi:hypothetical protein